MAMKRKPKPLRPDPSGIKADVRGRLSTKKTIVVSPKRRLTKSVVRNPSAPTAAGPRSGSVRVITKTETGMKRGKAGSNKSASTTKSYNYKPSTGNQKLIESTQAIARKGYIGLTPADKKAINPKTNKPSKVTPKKKAEPKPKPKPKRRYFGRSGGGMFGGGGAMNDYNR